MASLNLVASKNLESKKVLDIVGHEYGTIKDIIIDYDNNKILLAVVSEGGFAGTEIGSKYVAIPWNSLNVNPNTYTCTLRVNRGVINNAPRVNYKDLLNGEPKIIEQIFDYYGQPEHWDKSSNMDTIVTAEPVQDKHQSLKGSEKETKNHPDDESKLGNEMNFDKLTGKSDK